MINLYPDQAELVNEVRQSMRYYKRVLMQSATGSGKSVMAAYMIAASRAKGSRSVFIVPRRELMNQMSETFSKFHIPHSFVAPKRPFNQHAYSHIVSLQSLKKKLPLMHRPNIVFVDETHFGTNLLNEIIEYYTALGCFIVGLSATPMKMDGTGLECWYDNMVCGKSIKWLIENKRLSRYRAFAPSHVDLAALRSSGGDYARGQLDERMSDSFVIGNAVDHYKKHAMGKLNIAFCAGIKSSELTAEKFRSEGVPAMHVDGKTPVHELKRIIRAYANRELMVLCNSDLLTFGFDLASSAGVDVTVECMSDLRPTKSLPLQLQKWGRVLRYKDEPALIFDHANNFDPVTGHGLPSSDREWTLASRDKEERGEREIDIPVRQCPKCYRAHEPAPSCPTCGYIYPVQSREVKEHEGELEEIRLEEEKKKKRKRMEVGRAETYEDLREIARERGYKPGWVHQMARVKGIKE